MVDCDTWRKMVEATNVQPQWPMRDRQTDRHRDTERERALP